MKKTILVLAANPLDTDNVGFSREVDAIKDGLQKQGSPFKLEHQLATNIEKMRKSILQHKPTIVHFSGHGLKSETGIMLEDNNGGKHIVETKDIAEFFGIVAKARKESSIDCVVLNACYSEKQANAISQHIPYVIGIKNQISSDIALEFSVAFYDGILNDFPIEYSFDLACIMARIAIKEKGYTYEFAPVIKVNKKIIKKSGEDLFNQETESIIEKSSKGEKQPIDVLGNYIAKNIVKSKELIKVLSKLVNDPETKKIFDNHLVQLENTNKNLDNLTFSVAVMALIKAGKSTLLNAWLGNEFLPSNSRAETAQVVHIVHNKQHPEGHLRHGENKINGIEDIKAYIKSHNDDVRDNKASLADDLLLEAPFVALRDRQLGKYKFELLDTPGVNEDGLVELDNRVKDLLADVGVIIYLLDYMKLGTKDEADLFKTMKKTRSELVSSQDRLFIVVNRIDLADRNSLNPHQTRVYVSKLIKKYLGIDLSPNRVFLVSASRALLSRLILLGKPNIQQIEDIVKLIDATWRQGDSLPDIEILKPKAKILLELSNVENLEEDILSFIYSKRKSLLLLTVLDQLQRVMIDCENQIGILSSSSSKNQEDLKKIIQHLKGKLDKIKLGINKSRKPLEESKKKAKRAIEKHLDFNEVAYKKIKTAFENQEKAVEYYPKWVAAITRIKQHYRIESANKDEILTYLEDINSTIMGMIRFEMEKRIKDLEDEIYNIQEYAISELKNTAFEIVKEIDIEFSKALDIPLKSTNINLDYPNREDFFKNLNEEKDKFINTQGSSKLIYKPLGGWFPWWERTFIVEGYELNSSKYWENIRNSITLMKSSWLTFTNELIDKQIFKRFQEAENKLENRATEYFQLLNDSLTAKLKENEESTNRLTTINNVTQTQELLNANIENFKKIINSMEIN